MNDPLINYITPYALQYVMRGKRERDRDYQWSLINHSGIETATGTKITSLKKALKKICNITQNTQIKKQSN